MTVEDAAMVRLEERIIQLRHEFEKHEANEKEYGKDTNRKIGELYAFNDAVLDKLSVLTLSIEKQLSSVKIQNARNTAIIGVIWTFLSAAGLFVMKKYMGG